MRLSNPIGPRGFGDGTLVPFADCMWTATTPVRFAATWQAHVMTVIRLSGGGVLLHSPCRPSSALLEAIVELGRVTDVVAPNWFHDLYLADYRAAYPHARFWGPRVLKRQRKGLIDGILDGEERPEWFRELPYVTVPGLLTFDESVFYHVPTRTLIAADLLLNASIVDDAPLFTRFVYRIFHFDGSLKVFPLLFWFGQARRRAVVAAVQKIVEWNPQRIIVGHGTPIDHDAGQQLGEAFALINR